VRFFIDEGYFEEGETEILRAHIGASSGRLALSGESTAAFLSVKGYYVPDRWDVYFTIRQVGGTGVVQGRHRRGGAGAVRGGAGAGQGRCQRAVQGPCREQERGQYAGGARAAQLR
jgi:hypothetical protein